MSKRINTDDFFVCSGGLMPAKMQTSQDVMKKDNKTTLYITHIDVKTTSLVDFSCKKMMLLAALVAVLIAALIILTGGAASFLVAAAIGGAAGAAGGMLLCGSQAAVARKWIGYATQQTLVIKGNYSILDENYMICELFNERITIAPKIKNWWQAAAVGISNFSSEYFKCLMVGAGAAGLEVLATEGGSAFLANAVKNYAWTWGKGAWLRGAMMANAAVQDHYVQGNALGGSTAGAVVKGGLLGPEFGTAESAGNLLGITEHNTWQQTKEQWEKADGVDANKHGFTHFIAKANAISGVVSDASALLGWGGATARESEAFNNAINAIRANAPKFGQGKKGGTGDLYAEPAKIKNKTIEELKKELEESGTTITQEDIVDTLNGTTDAANKIADAIKDGRIELNILSDKEFAAIYKKLSEGGDSGGTTAFAYGEKIYVRASRPTEGMLTDIVHEGTHAMDYNDNLNLDTFESEQRAYRNEHEYQNHVGMDLEFENHDAIDKHIDKHY